jgi:penicillin amidase
MLRRALPIAVALLALAAVPATARVLDAQSVLPPGQSGFVNITGILDGTGSPHLTDQTPLWQNFAFKSELFDQPGATSEPRLGVKIVRDSYGVPAIHANNDQEAYWGVGYAVAQDRLAELELFRRATSGHLAELLGDTYLPADLIARRDYYTDAEVQSFIRKLPPYLLHRYEAYRDGINAYSSYVKLHPAELPGELPALLAAPPTWTVADSIRISIFLARTVPNSDGRELENAQALKELGPRGFNALLPLRTPGRLPTIPASEGTFPSQPGRTRKQEARSFVNSQKFVSSLPLPNKLPTASAKAREPQPVIPHGGSYMWGIGRKLKTKRVCHTRKKHKTCAVRKIQNRKAGNSYLFNGPELGFQIPELFVEFEVHYPGVNLRGASAPGIPVVGIGRNDHLAWGFTSGLSDTNDLYAEHLTGKETYLYKGQERKMDCRNEKFDWRASPTGIGDLITTPQRIAGSKTERICRTVHGPVQLRVGNVAYARRYAAWNREVESIVGISELNDAPTVQAVNKAMLDVTWNENVVAADDKGNIGYWHPGLHPLRPRNYDERLPYPGTGEAEWRGLLPRSQDPHVINPAQGFLYQWNNVPSIGWTNGDSEARERATGPFHRVRLLKLLVSRVAKNPSFAASTAIDRTSGTTAQQRPFFTKQLRAARKGAGGTGAGLLDALLAWDGSYSRVDSRNTVDPGVAAWEAFKEEAGKVAIAKLRPGAQGIGTKNLSGTTGKSHMFDITLGEAYAFRTLKPADLRVAAQRAADALTIKYRSSNPATWREPRRMYDVTAQGAASSPDFPFFDRGTFEHSVALGP